MFGEMLKREMQSRGMTVQDMSGFLGVPYNTLLRWTKSETEPNIRKQKEVLDKLGINQREAKPIDLMTVKELASYFPGVSVATLRRGIRAGVWSWAKAIPPESGKGKFVYIINRNRFMKEEMQ